jgi:hypothetical protein
MNLCVCAVCLFGYDHVFTFSNYLFVFFLELLDSPSSEACTQLLFFSIQTNDTKVIEFKVIFVYENNFKMVFSYLGF